MTSADAAAAEARLALWLDAYAEALATGRALDTASLPPLPADIEPQFQDAQECLRLLERVWPRSAAETTPSLPAPGPGAIGRFRIVRELGRGGYGIVYLAFDPLLQREVALKIPRPEAVMAEELRRRFLREAQVMAGLDHPNLVAVYEAGTAGPAAYLVSAYCPGPTLAAWLKQQTAPVPARAAAELAACLAEAVQYVHARGILHRDLKPGNILLEPRGERQTNSQCSAPELAAFQPRITDFGLAKLLERDASETQSGTVLGTAFYMAPEQAEGRTSALGPHTDVYALGVVLYEVLSGRPPFQGRTEFETIQQVLAAEPPPPARLRPDLPRDLETVCLKCLAKEPARRYASAAELAADLRRFLAGEPIRARPAGAGERLLKWVKRRPAAALLAGLSSIALVGLWIVGLWYNTQLRESEGRERRVGIEVDGLRAGAEQREIIARRRSYATTFKLAHQAWESGQVKRTAELLDSLRPHPGQTDSRGFEWEYLWRTCHAGRSTVRTTSFSTLAFSPNGKTLASGHRDGTVKLRDPSSGKVRATLEGYPGSVLSVAFSPDGRTLAAGGGQAERAGGVKLWDLATGREQANFKGHLCSVDSLAFSPDGRTLAAAGLARDGQGKVTLWDLIGKRARMVLQQDFEDVVHVVAFAPDGKTLATGNTKEGAVKLWELGTGRVRATLKGHRKPVWALAFSPSGKFLASSSFTLKEHIRGFREEVILWDLTSGKGRVIVEAEEADLLPLAFAPDGKTLAIGICTKLLYSVYGGVTLWDTASGRVSATLKGDMGRIHCLAFAPDGKTLATGSEDDRLTRWDLVAGQETASLAGHAAEAWAVAFAPDGKTLASGSDDETIKLWDTTSGEERATFRGHQATVASLAFAPDGETLASGGYDREVKLWDPRTREKRASLRGHADAVRTVAFAPDGRTLASGSNDRTIKLWDPETGKERSTLRGHTDRVRSVAFTSDGAILASGSEDGTVRLWDLASSRESAMLTDPVGIHTLAFAPDGKSLATGNAEGIVKVWELTSGRVLATLVGHARDVRCVAFAPDGKTLASGSEDATVRLWDPLTGEELATLRGHAAPVNSLSFSRKGDLLASASHDGAVKLWRAARPAQGR